MEPKEVPMKPGMRLADMTCPCGAVGDKSCGACKFAFYCSRKCQKAAWPAHKAECARIAESWRGEDAAAFGAYSLQVRRLLGVRPQGYGMFIKSEELGLVITTTFCPMLDPERGAAIRAIAEEAHADGNNDIAFILYRIAGSPDTGDRIHISDEPGPRMTAEEKAAMCELVVRSVAAAPSDHGHRTVALESYTGGDAEAQFRAGIMYLNGDTGMIDGKPLVSAACFWLQLAARQGHERAAAALATGLRALSAAKAVSDSGGLVLLTYGGDLARGAGGRLGRR